jgi:hypothetical protein
MNARPSPKILAFMERYKIDSDEIWLLPGGKSYAVIHAAIERIANEQEIEFEAPFHIKDEGEAGCSLAGYGKLQDIRVWTFGEATPKNCRNPYYAAMAEKRLKDRLALKLLGIHGTGGLYSEDEVDDAGERAPPAEDAIEKAYLHMINTMCTNRKQAEAFYKSNRGMIENLRKMTRDRVMDLLATISRQEVA